jgi:hypothetical protein
MVSTSPQDEFQAQLERLAAAAAKSTSAALTSKWIAASDDRVKSVVFGKLGAGHTLAGVTSAPSQRHGEITVVFLFDRAAGAVNLIDESFAATVTISGKRVIDIVDPYVAEDASTAAGSAMPFAMRIPSNARNVRVSAAAGAGYRAAEREFFRQRGMEGDPIDPTPGGGLPGRPPRPGGPGPDKFWQDGLPERNPWGRPDPFERQCRAFSPTATDLGTDTTTGDPPQTDDVENDGHTDYVGDIIAD